MIAQLVISQQKPYWAQAVDVAMTDGDNHFKHVIGPDENAVSWSDRNEWKVDTALVK